MKKIKLGESLKQSTSIFGVGFVTKGFGSSYGFFGNIKANKVFKLANRYFFIRRLLNDVSGK